MIINVFLFHRRDCKTSLENAENGQKSEHSENFAYNHKTFCHFVAGKCCFLLYVERHIMVTIVRLKKFIVI